MNLEQIIERDRRNNMAANTAMRARKESTPPGPAESAILWILALAILVGASAAAYVFGYRRGHAAGVEWMEQLEQHVQHSEAVAAEAVARMSNPQLLAGDRR